tara:strand:+ start:468 stop:701 length:234 start_codon:yes stop_codon:yes gene_type:complete
MIRIRSKTGEKLPIDEEAVFLEVCSSDGKVGCVFFEDSNGSIVSFKNEDEEAALYGKRFNVDFVDKVIDLGDRYKDV